MEDTASATTCNLSSLRSYRWRMQLGLLPKHGGTQSDMMSLIRSRRLAYEQKVQEYPFPNENNANDDDEKEEFDTVDLSSNETSNSNNTSSPETAVDLDPLTAMMMEETQRNERLQELDKKYRKEKARRKRGIGTGGTSGGVIAEDEDYDEVAVALQIIDKDLHRLAHPSGERKNDNDAQRKKILRHVLFIFNCVYEHEPGYRQGMHEIASYLLYSLELDNVDPTFLPSESYSMLETVLNAILPAYDYPAPTNTTNGTTIHNKEKPLEGISRRILAQVARVDPNLWQRLEDLNIPAAIYLVKWIRLLFSREVVHVLELWDGFFERISDNTNGHGLLSVLEATAASRLLHHRSELLSAHDNCLHLLMNMPVEQDVTPILEMVTPLLKGQTVSLPATQKQQQHQQQVGMSMPSTTTTTPAHHPITPAALDNVNSALTSVRERFSMTKVNVFTETLASKTQSISKRLYQEWENTMAVTDNKAFDDPLHVLRRSSDGSFNEDLWQQQERASHTMRAYDDPLFSPPPQQQPIPTAAAAVSSSTTKAKAVFTPSRLVDHYTQQQMPHQHQYQQQQPAPQARVSFAPQQWGQEMELHLAILQNFVMMLEKQSSTATATSATGSNNNTQTKIVPNAVWEALADLEVLRQDIVQHTTGNNNNNTS